VKNHFEAGEGVIAQGAVNEGSVSLTERRNVNVVVQNNGTRRFLIALDAGTLHEDHLGVVVGVGANLKLARLREGETR